MNILKTIMALLKISRIFLSCCVYNSSFQTHSFSQSFAISSYLNLNKYSVLWKRAEVVSMIPPITLQLNSSSTKSPISSYLWLPVSAICNSLPLCLSAVSSVLPSPPLSLLCLALNPTQPLHNLYCLASTSSQCLGLLISGSFIDYPIIWWSTSWLRTSKTPKDFRSGVLI